MPNEIESDVVDVVIVQTNHGLVFAVPVPPQSFEENSSNTLQPAVLVSHVEASDPLQAAGKSPQLV